MTEITDNATSTYDTRWTYVVVRLSGGWAKGEEQHVHLDETGSHYRVCIVSTVNSLEWKLQTTGDEFISSSYAIKEDAKMYATNKNCATTAH